MGSGRRRFGRDEPRADRSRLPRVGGATLSGPAGVGLFLVLAIVWPRVEGSYYSVNLGTLILTYAALSQTLNLVYGYLGYMSIAQVTFWGVGAYGAAKIAISWGWNPWLATIAGGLVAAVVAIPFGFLAMRRSRHAFAVIGIVTLLFAAQIANDWNSFTGGASGIVNLPTMSVPSIGITVVTQTQFYYAVLVVAGVALASIYLLASSRWGRLLKGIKADEELSASYGTNTTFHKVLTLAIGAFFAGTIGAVTAFRVSVIDPSLINMYYVAPILAIVLIGGGGSYFGVLAAAAVLTWIPEELRLADQFRDLFYGAALMAVALLLPEGVAPRLTRRRSLGTVSGALGPRSRVPPAPEVRGHTGAGSQRDELGTEHGRFWVPTRAGHELDRLSVNGLVKNFAGVRALAGVTFRTRAGIVQGIVGPNGSGKTTTIDCVTGFQRPDIGSIALDGRMIDRLPAHRRAHLGIRRTFQAVHGFVDMTVLDELMLASQSFDSARLLDDWFRTRRLRRVEREARHRAAEILEIVRLEHVIDDLVHELSYGQRKLVAIAGALMSSPRLLCLDEPVAGVSPSQVDEIAAVIRNLHEHHVTTLLVEHNIDFVTSVSDEVIVMSEGSVHTQGSPAVLHHDEAVFEVLFGER